MNLGEAGKKLIKSFEGCQLTAYKAVSTEKYWTIGYGHYGPDVKPGQKITQAQADALFDQDIQKYVKYVNDLGLRLNQNQFDALVSFCYNCGPGNLKTLCKGKSISQIAKDMLLYNRSGGKVLAGLVRRRQAEYKLFMTPVVKQDDGGAKLSKSQYEELKAEIESLRKLIVGNGDKPSNWAADIWKKKTAEGYFDGKNPKAAMTREQCAVVIDRLAENLRKYEIDPLKERLK